MAICIVTPHKTHMDETNSLMTIDMKQALMRKAVEAPEDIYATIKEAEEWLKELKEIARIKLNEKVPAGVKNHDIDTPNNVINITQNRGKFKPEFVFNLLTKLKIDNSKIVIETTSYKMMPEAYPLLEAYLRDKIITQAQFDSMFEEGNFTVKVKPKSTLAIALNSQNGE